MSAPEVVIDNGANGEDDDLDMGEDAPATTEDGATDGNDAGIDDLGGIETETTETPTFLDYLKSPIVELVTGPEDEKTVLYAHQALLVRSPYLATLISEATLKPLRISLPEDVAATASALEYLYKSDYFPALLNSSSLEPDPSAPQPDPAGASLLRHARVYTLARKLQLPSLATLAHRKIHLVESTARGEIAYARYVYANTPDADREMRRPVAQFWATRSHVLRHEAETEFRDMCLRFPQFGFDVLSMVLDAQERRSGKESAGVASSRKRARVSGV